MTEQSHSNTLGTARNLLLGKFYFSLSCAVGLFVLCLFIVFFLHDQQVIERELIVRAQMHFHSILITRRWNAMYGGVYVEKKNGVESNPYLINPDLVTQNGTVLTKKNPALMIREISELFNKAGFLSFHITSLNPLNPNNVATEFERQALQTFADGKGSEFYGEYKEGDKYLFQYMGPLFVEDSCLPCHGKQGYSKGDVRGGISVQYDITTSKHTEFRQIKIFIILSAFILITLFSSVYLLAKRTTRKLQKAQRSIEIMAITDELTGLYNRRFGFQRIVSELRLASRYGTPFSCLMMDIDHFKMVNDTYGHLTGDKVLRELARIVRENCRASDIPSRFGGEEFLIILPSTDITGAKSVAEKLRMAVLNNQFSSTDNKLFHLTVSFGCSSVRFGAKGVISTEDIVAAADKALYIAKREGRNRVECHQTEAESVMDGDDDRDFEYLSNIKEND